MSCGHSRSNSLQFNTILIIRFFAHHHRTFRRFHPGTLGCHCSVAPMECTALRSRSQTYQPDMWLKMGKASQFVVDNGLFCTGQTHGNSAHLLPANSRIVHHSAVPTPRIPLTNSKQIGHQSSRLKVLGRFYGNNAWWNVIHKTAKAV